MPCSTSSRFLEHLGHVGDVEVAHVAAEEIERIAAVQIPKGAAPK